MNKVESVSFENRAGKNMNARVTFVDNPKGIAFVQHGLYGSINEPHVEVIEKCYIDNSWITISINSTNSINDSDGNLDDFTVSRHKTDLSDSIRWAKKQDWFIDSIALAGHSMGGYSALMNADEYSDMLDHITSVSPFTSGVNLFQAWKKLKNEDFMKWKNDGYMECQNDGMIDRISYSNLSKVIDYSLFDDLDKIKKPSLFIVGSNDLNTPPDHVNRAYNRMIGDNHKMVIINDTDHGFTGHLDCLKKEIDSFLS